VGNLPLRGRTVFERIDLLVSRDLRAIMCGMFVIWREAAKPRAVSRSIVAEGEQIMQWERRGKSSQAFALRLRIVCACADELRPRRSRIPAELVESVLVATLEQISAPLTTVATN
jgi:hypothetical protein